MKFVALPLRYYTTVIIYKVKMVTTLNLFFINETHTFWLVVGYKKPTTSFSLIDFIFYIIEVIIYLVKLLSFSMPL